MKQKRSPMMETSSQDFYETAYKLLANPDIFPAEKFIAALTKPTENNEEEKLRVDHMNFFHFCAVTFPGCLSLKLMRLFTSREPRVSDEIRDNAIWFLYGVLHSKDEEEEEASLDLAMIRELSPMLITCLEEKVISDLNFKILSQIVNRIALEMFTVHESTWHGLREFISSRAETEFAKSVFLFKSLSMPLDGDEFVLPLMENLLPAILKRLGEEREWVLAFLGGFCAAVHLLETTRVDLVESLAYKMLESVKIGIKLGFLRKALNKVRMVVVKQLGWYCSSEFRFVLGLIQRIDAITEADSSKIVLKRIRMAVEKKMLELGKVIDNGEDWLNKKH